MCLKPFRMASQQISGLFNSSQIYLGRFDHDLTTTETHWWWWGFGESSQNGLNLSRSMVLSIFLVVVMHLADRCEPGEPCPLQVLWSGVDRAFRSQVQSLERPSEARGLKASYPLVIWHSYGKHTICLGENVLEMVIFNSYVELPEGKSTPHKC